MNLPAPGDRIRLIGMGDDPLPVPPGTTGTVRRVHSFASPVPTSASRWVAGRPVATQLPAPDVQAQIFVDWDVERSSVLLHPNDLYTVIEDR